MLKNSFPPQFDSVPYFCWIPLCSRFRRHTTDFFNTLLVNARKLDFKTNPQRIAMPGGIGVKAFAEQSDERHPRMARRRDVEILGKSNAIIFVNQLQATCSLTGAGRE